MASYNYLLVSTLVLLGAGFRASADIKADSNTSSASNPSGAGSSSTTTFTSGSGDASASTDAPKSTHHRRHHLTKSASAAAAAPETNATPAAPTSAGTPGENPVAPATATQVKTAAATTPRAKTSSRHHGSKSATTQTGSNAVPQPATNSATAGRPIVPNTGITAPTAPAAAASAHPLAGNPSSLTPSAVPATNTTTTTVVTSADGTTTQTTTTKTGRHHRQRKGKTATASATPGASSPPAGPGNVPPAAAGKKPVASGTGVVPGTTSTGFSPTTVSPGPTVGLGPTVQTGLPVAKPGSGNTSRFPASSARAPGGPAGFPFTDYTDHHSSTRSYPWKANIRTTVFWIGEGSTALSSMDNLASAWDIDWTSNNGGSDDPSDMAGYASASHASTVNPFYVALPFNDLAYPDKARRWLPTGWYRPPRGGKAVSACQHRWVEIKNRAGLSCFAQWEDVGPLVSDHAEYVFGPERPTTLTRAGLDVSPAVARYLHIPRNSSDFTSWRFVDDDDVKPGMWLKYDEQAVIFKAIKEQVHHHPIQDLSEPVPDESEQESNQKRIGAAH